MDAVADGTLTEERINESLHRIYRVKYADSLNETQPTEASDEVGTEVTAEEMQEVESDAESVEE